jgi:hypothetical protein
MIVTPLAEVAGHRVVRNIGSGLRQYDQGTSRRERHTRGLQEPRRW